MRFFAHAQNDKPALSIAVALCPTLAGLLNEYVGVNASLTHISIYPKPKFNKQTGRKFGRLDTLLPMSCKID